MYVHLWYSTVFILEPGQAWGPCRVIVRDAPGRLQQQQGDPGEQQVRRGVAQLAQRQEGGGGSGKLFCCPERFKAAANRNYGLE